MSASDPSGDGVSIRSFRLRSVGLCGSGWQGEPFSEPWFAEQFGIELGCVGSDRLPARDSRPTMSAVVGPLVCPPPGSSFGSDW